MSRHNKSRKSLADSLPLVGKVCLVEASRREKIDKYIKVVEDLGGTISHSIGDHLTHYIVSQSLFNSKRIFAAQLLDIKTIQLAWIDRCKELNQLVSEIDYEISVPSSFVENYLSKSMNRYDKSSEIKHGFGPDTIGLPMYDEDEDKKIQQQQQVIPLPMFREYKPPIVIIPPNKAASMVMVKRRSERISDLNSDDGHLEDLFDYRTLDPVEPPALVGRGEGGDITNDCVDGIEHQESLEVVLNLPVDIPLPVIYYEGESSDKHVKSYNQSTAIECISTTAASSSLKQSNSGAILKSNLTSSNKRKADTILTTDNIRNNSKRGCKSNISTTNAAAITTSQIKIKETIIPTQSRTGKAVTDTTALISSIEQYHRPVRSQPLPLQIQQAQSQSSSATSLWKANMVIALTGFNDKNGEKSTITSALKQLIRTVKKKAANTVKSNPSNNYRSSSSSNSKKDHCIINPLEAHVLLLTATTTGIGGNEDDFSTYSCNIVIASKKSLTRTLRILFALARGLLIVTEEWIYQSVSQESWADPRLFPHPRFGYTQRIQPSIITNPQAINIFKATKICVVECRDPSSDILISLIQTCGGNTTKEVTDEGCDYILFGDQSDASNWVTNSVRKNRHIEIECIHQFSKTHKVVTRKFLFNCIEARKIHQPVIKDDEIVSVEGLLANYSALQVSVIPPPPIITTTTSVKKKTRASSSSSMITATKNPKLESSAASAEQQLLNKSSSYSTRCKDTLISIQSTKKNSNILENSISATPRDWNNAQDTSSIAALNSASPVVIQLTATAVGFTAAKELSISKSASRRYSSSKLRLNADEKFPEQSNYELNEDYEEYQEEGEEKTLLDGNISVAQLYYDHCDTRTSNTQLAATSLLSLSSSKQLQQQQLYVDKVPTPSSPTHHNSTSRRQLTNEHKITAASSGNTRNFKATVSSTAINSSGRKHKSIASAVVTDFVDPYASYNTVAVDLKGKKDYYRKSSLLKNNLADYVTANETTADDDIYEDESVDTVIGNRQAIGFIDNLAANKNLKKGLVANSSTLIAGSKTQHSKLKLQTTTSASLIIGGSDNHTTEASAMRSSGRLIKNKNRLFPAAATTTVTAAGKRMEESDDDIEFTPSQPSSTMKSLQPLQPQSQLHSQQQPVITPSPSSMLTAIAGRVHRSEEY